MAEATASNSTTETTTVEAPTQVSQLLIICDNMSLFMIE